MAAYIEDADQDTKVQTEKNSDEDKIRFDTAGAERMIIDNAGNVGIGTTSPNYRLDINGNLRLGVKDANNILYLSRYSTADKFGIVSTPDTDSGIIIAYRDSNGSGQNGIVLTSIGNVGVGITNPGAKLSLGSSGTVRTFYTYENGNRVRGFGNDLAGLADGYEFDMYAPNASNGKIAFGTMSDDGAFTFSPKMVILPTGNVGIGTTSPGAALDVRGGAIFNEDGGDYDFRVEGDTDTNLLFIDASGDNVGIGTSSACAYKLAVKCGSNGLPLILYNNGTSHYANYAFLSGGALKLEVYDSASSVYKDLAFAPNGGNVGIGVSLPSSKLDVNGDIEIGNSNALYIGDPNTDDSIRISRDSSAKIFKFEKRVSGTWGIGDIAANDISADSISAGSISITDGTLDTRTIFSTYLRIYVNGNPYWIPLYL